MDRESQGLKIFISYSHRDEAHRRDLEDHLAQLRREGRIAVWHDRKIGAGREFAGAIDEALEAADIVLLLVSARFLASDYCYDIEMKRAMARHAAGEARVVPVILGPCEWRKAPFGKLNALPVDGKPVVKWRPKDDAYTDIARGLRAVCEEIAETRKTGHGGPRICNLPPRNLNFTGRQDRLREIEAALTAGRQVVVTQAPAAAVTGLGGIGKTQLATEYAHRHAVEYDLVW